MSIGIYMPCFQVGKYIEDSIKSIKNQTHKDWELVILDDGSSDNTYENAIKYASYNISVFKHNEHSGKIGNLKNEAISKFTNNHEYICHIGSDDLIPPYCLKTFVEYMNSNPEIGACCGKFICFNEQGQQWVLPHVVDGEFNSDTLLRYNSLFPMRFYRRKIIEDVGGYDNNLTSAVDYDLALKLDEKTKIGRIYNVITYYYRQHSQQVSTKSRGEQDTNAKKALESALKRRNIDGKVLNSSPPFIIEYNQEEHFIWGKK